jgi:non-ribosomal peptide synthetase component F
VPPSKVMFAFWNSQGVAEASKAGESAQAQARMSECDFTLSISDAGNSLEGFVDYSTDLFEAQTIRRLCAHYGALLESVANEPAQNISTLPILTIAERPRVWAGANFLGQSGGPFS